MTRLLQFPGYFILITVLMGSATVGCTEEKSAVTEPLKMNEQILGPDLTQWCKNAEADERLTVLIRTKYATDIGDFSERILRQGVTIESSGRGGTSAIVTCDQLAQLSTSEDVLKISPPRELILKFPE